MQFTTLFAITALLAGQAFAISIPRDDAFSNFASGKGSKLFGNAGTACTVGSEDGECDRFGRCVQEIPPNELNVLNQGRTVAVCTAGGQTGTL
ncbi:hypothetical protein B0O99DRAFT_622551 [Bisporella sp. PMI_857]|nr:hypothetical protein B0O99DRAFT_622551 [Bisporella sp. PMI_857]